MMATTDGEMQAYVKLRNPYDSKQHAEINHPVVAFTRAKMPFKKKSGTGEESIPGYG